MQLLPVTPLFSHAGVMLRSCWAHAGVTMQVMQAYERSPVPRPGEEFEFCPDASLQPVHYLRGRASEGLGGRYVHRAAVAAAEAEAGEGLGSWSVAALCRSLSLDNILLLLTGQSPIRGYLLHCRSPLYFTPSSPNST